MIYSTTCAYAIRAMSRLTMIKPAGYVRINQVCEGTDLPASFVAKIFQDLARGGLLVSARGRGGGFALARDPQQITLYDIVAVVDGVVQYSNCVTCMAKCDDKQACAQHDAFKPVRSTIVNYLNSTTLKQISEALATKVEVG